MLRSGHCEGKGIWRLIGASATAPDLLETARFDGWFFTGVVTTRIYCRPICPVKPAKSRNVIFFPTAAAAERCGVSPLLAVSPRDRAGDTGVARCGGDGLARNAAHRAWIPRRWQGHRRISPSGLGMTSRHLRRLFVQHAGASPTAVVTTRRVQRAKGARRRDRDANVRDCLRRGLRQHPTIQRRVSRRVRTPPTAVRRARHRHGSARNATEA